MPKLLLTLPYAAQIGGVESWFSDLCECLPPLGWDVKALGVVPANRTNWTPPAYWPQVHTLGKPWWTVRDYAQAVRIEIERQCPDLVLSYAYDAPLISGPNVPAGPRVIDGVYTGLPAEDPR